MTPHGGGAPASSTLSPLAPPFTVAPPPPSCRFTADPERNRLHPAPPAVPAMDASRRFLGPDWLSTSSAAPRRSIFDGPGAPYYPRSSPSVGGVPADDAFEPLPEPEGYGRVGVGRWRGPFDGDDAGCGDGGSSLMESSLDYKVPSFQEGVWREKHVSSFARKVHLGSECSEWLHDRHPAIYKENAIAPYNISGESLLAPSALPKGMSYSQLPDSSSNFSSNSYYDGYMGYPAKACSTSAQVHAPSSRRTSSFVDSSMSKNGYSIVQPVDPYRIGADRENHISTNPMELNINQNVEVKKGYDEMTSANNMKKHTNITEDPFSFKTGLPSDSDIKLANGNSIDSSTEAVSGLKLKPLNLPSAFISECGPAESNDSMGTSSQTLDQLNLAVDSPCWKGASVSRQSPFGLAETAGRHPIVTEWKGCVDMDQGQKHLPLVVAYTETLPSLEQVGTLICDYNKNASSESNLRELPVVILPSIWQNLYDANKAGPDCLKDDNEKGIHCSDTCKKQSNEVRKDQNGDSEAKENEVTRLGKEETAVSANQPITGDGVVDLETDLKAAVRDSSSDVSPHGKPSSLGNNIQLLVKAMHSLSEVLLSSYYSGTNELKEHDHELLQLAIHNLETFTLRNKKAIASGIFHVSGLEASGSWDADLKADVMNPTNGNTTHDMKGEVHSTGSSMNNVFKGGVTESSKFNGMADAFEKVLEKTLFEPEENPQALVYKNLWIEAEAALCSMKYGLQLARMKIEMENRRHPMKGRSPQMTGLSSWNSIHDLDGHDTPQKATSVEQQMHLGLVDDGARMGAREMMGNPRSVDESSVGPEHLPANLVDLGFMESNTQPNTNDDTRNRVKVIGVQFCGGDYDRAFVSNVAGEMAIREFHGSVAEGSVIKRNTSTRQGKRFLAGGRDSPSSEWEHVLKEDLTC